MGMIWGCLLFLGAIILLACLSAIETGRACGKAFNEAKTDEEKKEILRAVNNPWL